MIKTFFLRIYNLITYRHFIKENTYAHLFNDAKNNIEWLKGEVIFPSKSAANYSLMYILLRILLDAKPKKILEFGLGQTTKLTGSYANEMNASLNVIEHNNEWLGIYKYSLTDHYSDNIVLQHSVLKEANLKEMFSGIDYRYKWYSSLPYDKYDLIILDGPTGTDKFSRCGILNIIPKYLNNEFIIVIDDYNVFPTRQTASLLKRILVKNNISFSLFITEGTKQQLCIVSDSYRFLATV